MNKLIFFLSAIVMLPTMMYGRTKSEVTEQEMRARRHAEIEYLRDDTVYIQKVDTVYVLVDTLMSEHPFTLNRNTSGLNWFITFGGGPTIFQGDHNKDADWSDRIYPSFNLSVGKWIIPFIGIRAGVDFDKVHLYCNGNPEYHNKGVYDKKPWMHKMGYNMWNFRADLMFNLSSLIWRPHTKRIYSCIPYFGMGCIATWDEPFDKSMSLNVGLLNSFRVCEQLDINLDLRLRKFDDSLNTFIQGRKKEASSYLSIGATWHFTKRGF